MAAHAEALLTASEITEVVDLLKQQDKVEADTTFRRVSVAHPNGTDERRGDAWLYTASDQRIDHYDVSLSSGSVSLTASVHGQVPQYGFGEIDGMIAAVRADPAVAAAVKKRGIDDPSKLQVDCWPTGNMGLATESA